MSNLRYLPSSNHRQKFCLLGFSESWTWPRRRNFPLPWISSSCGHSELNEALSHSCRIVSHESWFCRKSPGTLLLCFYWRFMINQRREVLAKLWKQKKPLHFSASVSSLDEWMKPLRNDLKLVRRLPKIPILKSVWGFSVFRNSSPAMVSDVTCIDKILITKLNRKIARQPIGISKKQHRFEDQALKIDTEQKFYLCGSIWYPINSLNEQSSVSDRGAWVILRLDQVKTK